MGFKPRKNPSKPCCTKACPHAGLIGKAEQCERARCTAWPNTYLGPCACSCHKTDKEVLRHMRQRKLDMIVVRAELMALVRQRTVAADRVNRAEQAYHDAYEIARSRGLV